jgi:flagellar hook assembly protein FlgD
MRKLIKTITAAAFGLLLLNASVFATAVDTKAECKNNSCENFRVGMYRIKNSLSMNVLLEKTKGERVTLRLLNEKGVVLHEESIGKSLEKCGRKLNFAEVQDGNYTLEISDSNEKIVKNISLRFEEVSEVRGRSLVAIN